MCPLCCPIYCRYVISWLLQLSVCLPNTLSNYLKEFSVNFSKGVSLATDSAREMGEKVVLGYRYNLNLHHFVIQTHCVAHRWAITVSIKQIEQHKKLKESCQTFHICTRKQNVCYKTNAGVVRLSLRFQFKNRIPFVCWVLKCCWSRLWIICCLTLSSMSA